MKSVTQLNSLGDMKTSISTHSRATPRQKGATYLGIYLLDKEKQRLETELAMLSKRQRRIEGRLAELQKTMEMQLSKAEQADSLVSRAPASAVAENQTPGDNGVNPRKWKKMTIEY